MSDKTYLLNSYDQLLKSLKEEPIRFSAIGHFVHHYDDVPEYDYSFETDEDREIVETAIELALCLYEQGDISRCGEFLFAFFDAEIEFEYEMQGIDWDYDFSYEDDPFTKIYDICYVSFKGKENLPLLKRILFEIALQEKDVEKLSLAVDSLNEETLEEALGNAEDNKENRDFIAGFVKGDGRNKVFGRKLSALLAFVKDRALFREEAIHRGGDVLLSFIKEKEGRGEGFLEDVYAYLDLLDEPKEADGRIIGETLFHYDEPRLIKSYYECKAFPSVMDCLVLFSLDDFASIKSMGKGSRAMEYLLNPALCLESYVDEHVLWEICYLVTHQHYSGTFGRFSDGDSFQLNDYLEKGVRHYFEFVNPGRKEKEALEKASLKLLENHGCLRSSKHYENFAYVVSEFDVALGHKRNEFILHFKELYPSRYRLQEQLDKALK